MHIRATRVKSMSKAVAVAVVFAVTAAVGSPAFAATDDRLALYVSNFRLSGDQPLAIRTVQADGAEPRDIYAPESFLADNRWSPDGSEIASVESPRRDSDPDGPRSLRVSAQDGSSQRTLATDVAPSRVADSLTWTNDGTHLAYISGPQVDTRLSLVRRDGSARAVIDTGRQDMQHLQWSPDGELVTFSSRTPEGALGIFAVNPQGGDLRLLAEQSSGTLSWSPDGDRFIYLRNAPENTHLPRIVRRDGSVEREFPIQHAQALPSWAPDGKQIALLRTNREADGTVLSSIVIADADTGAERPLGFLSPEDHKISGLRTWSPDSRQLIVHTRSPAQPASVDHFWVVEADTGEGRELTLNNARMGNAEFAPVPTTPPAIRGTSTACDGAPDSGFADTAGSTFEAQIDCVAWYEIARGTTENTYTPGAVVNRAQMAQFLTRLAQLAGADLDTSDAGFTDLDGLSQDARDTVNAVANLGVARGVTTSLFAPARPVTRAQMASFLSRLHTAVSGEELGPRVHCFADISSSVHRAAIERLCGAGVAAGPARGAYAPESAVTRAQMAGFLARLLDIEVEAGRVERPAQQ
jgi:Tol biopolymer transport system component